MSGGIPAAFGATCDRCDSAIDGDGLCPECDEKPEAAIKIEKGMPVPPISTNRGAKYPWDKLEVGDSFKCEPRRDQTLASLQSSLSSSFRRWRAQHGLPSMRLVTRKRMEGGVEVIRAWRAS